MSSIASAAASSLKSTNGRSYMKVPRPVTLGFRGLAALLPGPAERLASWMFCHPHRAPLHARDKAVLETGERARLRIGNHDVVTWTWGDGPTVLLHHGWGGRASQMAAFVDPLLRAGYRVVAYDAPAHGGSPGQTTGVPVFAQVLRGLADRLGGVHAIVAHSAGCAATMLAIRQGLSVDRAVLLAPPADMRVFLAVFADHFAMNRRLRNAMTRRIAAWFDIDWAEMHAGHWAQREQPPLLVLHDRDDSTVPWSHGHAVRQAWKGAELVTTDGLGHQRIRRDPEVIERAVAFLERTAPETRPQ